MKTLLALVVFVVVPVLQTSVLHAQIIISDVRQRFGVSADVNFNFHSADFKQLPNVENCCPLFENGRGSGYTLGLLYEYPFSHYVSLGVRMSFSLQDATLQASEFVEALDTSYTPVTTTIQHRITTQLSTFGAEPMLNIRAVGGLYFHAGSRLAFLSGIHYSQVEEMTTPGFVFKENLQRTRNQQSGDIQNVVSFQHALLFGASIELPLNNVRTLFLSPQIFFQLGTGNLINGTQWTANALRLGISLKFASTPAEFSE